MMDLFSLRDRVVLLTGATGGIGNPTARLLASAGAELILSSNQPDPLDALATDLRNQGSRAWAIAGDLATADDVSRIGRTAIAEAGRVDVLICNGGMEGHVGPLGEAAEQDIDTLFAVNLRSAMILSAELAPGMAERGRGSIVLVASIAGLRGNKAIGLYGIAKAGLTQLGRNLAVEWGPSGVRANTISPGLIRTSFAQPILGNPDFLPRRLGLTPLRRPGEPDEIAASILYLASDASGFMTGHNLVVDGGTTISDGN